jgi:hypothetical protein
MTLEADAVKFVLFAAIPATQNILSLWQNASGGSLPQSFQQPQQLGAPALAQGTYGLFSAALIAQPGRIELALTANPLPLGKPDTIKDINAALVSGANAIKRIATQLSVNRIGLIIESTESMSDNAASIARLVREFPFLKLPQGASDLTFQLNSKLAARSARNTEVNRLCKWSTATKQVLQFQLGIGGSNSQGATVVSSTPVFGFTIDLNTFGNSADFSGAEVDELTDELVGEAQKLMEKGYAHLA